MIAEHLVNRGLAGSTAELDIQPLAGGVSNDVFAVTGPGLDVVVKRALGRLRVAETWLADPGRIDTEGRALRLAGRITPGAVPNVIDLADFTREIAGDDEGRAGPGSRSLYTAPASWEAPTPGWEPSQSRQCLWQIMIV